MEHGFGMKNVKISPYTWKGIASVAATALVGIAMQLSRIADAMEKR